MAMSAFQKVTLVTCLVLCVALLLPKMLLSRGKKDAAHAEGNPGRFPPMVHRQAAPDSKGQSTLGSQFSRSHNTEAIARAKGGGTGAGTGGKSNLAGQIIPIYGFGILMYILYILFKITSKGNTKPKETKFPSVRSENLKRKITDFELTQLQEKLKETEMVMEKIVSKASHSPERVRGVSADQEETLLLQLREITRVMQERHLVEGVAPEKKAGDWEGFPEDPHQCWEMPFCGYNKTQQYTPEEEAERTEPCGVDQEDGVANQADGVANQADGVANQEDGVAYQEDGVAYQEDGVANQEEGVAYQEDGVANQADGVANQEDGVAYQDDGGAYQEDGRAYQEDGVANQEDGGAYQDEASPDQEKCGACQEEVEAHMEGGVSHQEEGGADLEKDYAVGEACKTDVLNVGQGEDIAGDKECWAQEDMSVMDEDNLNEEKVEGGKEQIGVATDGISLDQEVESTLGMSAMQEPEGKTTVHLPNNTSTSSSRVRRRHKKKNQRSAFKD